MSGGCRSGLAPSRRSRRRGCQRADRQRGASSAPHVAFGLVDGGDDVRDLRAMARPTPALAPVTTAIIAAPTRPRRGRFAARGCDVAIIARNEMRLEATAGELRERGVRALPIVTDVADASAIEAAAERAEAELRPIDIWVTMRWRRFSRHSTGCHRRNFGAAPKSPISARYTARWRRSNACGDATAARSS